jgi:hypothetical protein
MFFDKISLSNLSNIIPYSWNNKYKITIILFIIWVVFIDNNSFITLYSRYKQINEINKQISFYKVELSKTEEEYKALFNKKTYFEKFVRERYFLKKENEDLFIFSQE